MPDLRSEGLVLYLGKGVVPYPQRDPQRLIERYGSEVATSLISYCEKVLDELYGAEPDWTSEDLSGATERAVALVASVHPELTEQALASLKWSYSWDWK